MVRYALLLSSVVLFTGILISGCGRDTDFLHHQLTAEPHFFSGIHKLKELEGEDKVDILFVIDNSGSMGTYQQALIRNADSFINAFIANGGLDWKMGIVSTDDSDEPYIGLKPGDELTHKSVDNIKRFKDAVDLLGTNGDAVERTFSPVMKLLPRYPGFLRPNAILAIIMITDAAEQSAETATDFLDFLRVTKGGLKKVVSYGVFAPSDFGCSVSDSIWNYAGSPYEELIKATSGKTYPLCKDFGAALADLGKDLVSRISRPSIRLQTRPRLRTLTVNYLGKPLKGGPQSEGGYWIYDFDMNSIRFHNLDFAPGENEEVEIVYEVAE